MSDLIDREALKRWLEMNKANANPLDYNTKATYAECITMVDSMETVEAEPVRHGHWVKCQGKSNIWYCSECGEKINYKQNRRTYNIPKVPVWQKNKRCRNCGAKMGGAEDASNP